MASTTSFLSTDTWTRSRDRGGGGMLLMGTMFSTFMSEPELLGDRGLEFLEVAAAQRLSGLPVGGAPELGRLAHAGPHDVLVERGVLAERRRHEDAPLLV